jgi:hypothetical protein
MVSENLFLMMGQNSVEYLMKIIYKFMENIQILIKKIKILVIKMKKK